MKKTYVLMLLLVSAVALTDVSNGACKDISNSTNLLQGYAVVTSCSFNDGGIGSINDGLGNWDIIGLSNYDWDPNNATAITGFGGTGGSAIGTIRVWYDPFDGVRPFTGFHFKSSKADLSSQSAAYREDAANYETDLGTNYPGTAVSPSLPTGWIYVDATGYEVASLYYYDIAVKGPDGTKSLWFHYLDGTTALCPLLREVQAFPPPPEDGTLIVVR